jgi:predicted permease
VTNLLHDLRYAFRTFARTPGFTVVAILVLALGIGANSAIFSIVNALLFRPLSGHADELVGVYSHDSTKPDSYRAFSYPNYVDIRERSGVFAGLLAHTMTSVGVGEGGNTRRTFVALASSNYFDTLGVRLAAGRTFSLDEERPGADQAVAIVNYGMWLARDLAPDFIGSTIRINARDFTVVGVTPKGFTGTMALAAPDMWLPLGMYDRIVRDRFKNRGTGLEDRANAGLILAGRIQPGLDEAVVTERLAVLSRQLEEAYPGENRNQILTINPLARLATSTSPQTDTQLVPVAGVMMALSAVVLLIACLNIANMLLARGAARRREVAVRLAVGAARGRIIRQLLTEGLLLAAAGAGGGLLFAYWSMRTLASSMAAVLPLTLTLNPIPDTRVILVTSLFAVAGTLLFGLGPALKLSRRDLVSDLKEVVQDAVGMRRMFAGRNLLVIGQIALSLTLLTAGGLFAGAALRAGHADPGFTYRGALLASFDIEMAGVDGAVGRETYRRLLERVRALPGLDAAGLASTVPFGDTQEGRRVETLGASPARVSADYRVISSDYFRALGLQMVQGREFSQAEDLAADGPLVAIVDEALARRLFPDRTAVGETIRLPAAPDAMASTPELVLQVVGVAPPITEEITEVSPRPHIYLPYGRNPRGPMHLHARTAAGMDTATALAALRQELQASHPDLPVLALTTMQAFHENSLQLWALNAGGTMFITLGLLALILAVVGIYGVKSYVVANRTREIGIRMALGAHASQVVWMVLRDGLSLTATGLALGVPLSVGVAFVLRSVFANLTGFDPLVFAGAPALLAAAALVASYIPARRATEVTPLSALRSH